MDAVPRGVSVTAHTAVAAAALWLALTQSSFGQAGEASPPVVVGPVYEIKEPSMLDELMKRLKADEASGVLQRKIEEGQRRALNSIRNPRGNDLLIRAETGRHWYYDPTVTATEDIVANGSVIVRAGTSVNPLDRVNWSRLWLFIDARDSAQVGHARQLAKTHGQALKVILTAGSYETTARSLGFHVYFDQHAVLTTRFGIQALPATVRQEGRRLRIDEVKL